MTGVGIYIIIVSVIGILANFYFAGQGGVEYTPGVLIFGSLWAILNIILILNFGTGSL